jgi:hypothetical protein
MAANLRIVAGAVQWENSNPPSDHNRDMQITLICSYLVSKVGLTVAAPN